MRSIDHQFGITLRQSVVSALIIALFVTLIINSLTRRELNVLVEISNDSKLIAAGNLEVLLPQVDRPKEVAELSAALHDMVGSLRRAIELASDSENRMREFLGDTAHELRTPLTVIRGYIDILSSGRELPTGQTDRALRRLSHESQRMSSIIDDLLLLAEMGEVTTSIDELVDFSSIIHQSAQDLAEQQPDRPVTENVTRDVLVQGNAPLLERLLSNLVANIRQHTSPTTPVMFTLTRHGNTVVLTVDDAGPGLSEQMYSRATEGFQRFDRHRSSLGGGFGLGLSIISSVVSAHHGTLHLNPSFLGGLQTRVVLPATQDAARTAVRHQPS
jgi:two-component system OmpR family sensor kinase